MNLQTKKFELCSKVVARLVSYLCICRSNADLYKSRIKIKRYENKSNFIGFIVNFNISNHGKITSKNQANSRT